MRYLSFTIKNYKGIKEAYLPFLRKSTSKSKIFTLVGLNESGKTTILEALDFFYSSMTDRSEYNKNKLIPRHFRYNFNDEVSISTKLLLEQPEIDFIKDNINKTNYSISHKQKIEMVLSLNLIYKDSQFNKETFNHEMIGLEIKSKRSKNSNKKTINEINKGSKITKELIKKYLPEIIYYQDFIFDFPRIINLESYDEERSKLKQSICRFMLQDVLNSVDKNLDLKKHITDRLKRGSLASILEKPVEDITATIFQSSQQSAEDTVSKMQAKVNEVVMKSLDEIFQFKKTSPKAIELTLIEPSEDNNNKVQIQFSFKDGQDSFEIEERSMGFRWFFSFLMLMLFRGHRYKGKRGMLFLLDEPASNLHQTAQSQILKLLQNMTHTSSNIHICYSTHSLHLINPKWLEDAFVVFNQALDYKSMKENFKGHETEVSLERYRKFVNDNPGKTHYFQPILDHLSYRPSNLEFVKNAVFVEGKYDFYSYNYFMDISRSNSGQYNFTFVPIFGSDSISPIIQLYLGWGKNFAVLLDGDDSGKNSKRKYEKKFSNLIAGKIHTLEDIDSNWKNYKLENLIVREDKEVLGKDKKTINLKIQELLKIQKKPKFTPSTMKNFTSIFTFINEKLESKD